MRDDAPRRSAREAACAGGLGRTVMVGQRASGAHANLECVFPIGSQFEPDEDAQESRDGERQEGRSGIRRKVPTHMNSDGKSCGGNHRQHVGFPMRGANRYRLPGSKTTPPVRHEQNQCDNRHPSEICQEQANNSFTHLSPCISFGGKSREEQME